MLFDPSTTKDLRPWLIRSLEPICDADPEVLSDYVLALLKHDAPESTLRAMFVKQLDDFLQHQTTQFVDSLLSTLKSKDYLKPPPSKNPSQPASVPPTTALNGSVSASSAPLIMSQRNMSPKPSSATASAGQKRRLEDSDDQEAQRKGSRLMEHSGGAPSRPLPQDNSSIDMMTDSVQMSGTMQGMAPPRPRAAKGICYNYHNHGYCSRGATCPYSHGDDPVPMNLPFQAMQNSQPGPMPWMPPDMMGMNFQMPFMMNPNLMNPRGAFNGGNRRGRGGRFQQRRDEDTVMVDVTPNQMPQPIYLNSDNQPSEPSKIEVFEGDASSTRQNFFVPSIPPQPDVTMQYMNDTFNPNPTRNHRGGPAGRRGTGFNNPTHHRGAANMVNGRGTFQSELPSLGDAPESSNTGNRRSESKTLVVEKIPPEHLKLEAVNGWFKRFGTVTNVAVDSRGSKALVSFQTHEEARTAWKSEDAVFGNRFVKVFWHRPMEGQGQAGAKALVASAPLVKHIATAEDTPPVSRPHSAPSATTTEPPVTLENQIAEQKALFNQLSTASPEEKKTIMTRLRKLGEEMKALPTSTNTARTGSSEAGEGGAQDSSAALRAKLASLQAEATRLGVDATAQHGSQPSYRSFPPRGRGRGRGRGTYYRGGRGGPPLGGNKTLDLRPRKLSIKGVGVEGESHTAVREWYEVTGELESFQVMPNGDIHVLFRTRQGAEQALGKGSNIKGVGPVHISWQVDGFSNATTDSSLNNGFETDTLMGVTGESGSSSGDAFDFPVGDDHQYEADDVAGAWAFP